MTNHNTIRGKASRLGKYMRLELAKRFDSIFEFVQGYGVSQFKNFGKSLVEIKSSGSMSLENVSKDTQERTLSRIDKYLETVRKKFDDYIKDIDKIQLVGGK